MVEGQRLPACPHREDGDSLTHTHTHTQGQHRQEEHGLPLAPLQHLQHAAPTRPHNTTLFLILKLLPLEGTPRPFPSHPVPSLSSRPGPGSHISHLILQFGIVRLSFALLLFIRRHVGVVGLREALGTRAGKQVVLPEYLVAAVSAPLPLTAV